MKLFLFIFILLNLNSQDKDIRFISYNSIPTWSGLASNWKTSPKIHFYDSEEYKGHSEFISRGLGRQIKFEEFKLKCQKSSSREYFPFFIYDLSERPYKTKNGISINWAIRIEDYSYDDSPANLVLEILKLKKLILQYDKSFSEKGLIILSNEKKSSLNGKSLGKFLEQQNEFHGSLDDLLQIYGTKKQLILNNQTSFGRLKLVKNELELNALKETDIAVLDFIPIQIPNIAGIISLRPQSPLSHINLLAKNRNIFNAYIKNIQALPNLKNFIGQNVKLYAENDRIFLKKINESLVKKNIRKNSISIPIPLKTISEIIPIAKVNSDVLNTNQFGAKVKNYLNLINHVPMLTRPAFAIGFKYYFDSISGEAETLIKSFLANEKKFSKEEKRKGLSKLRLAILEKGKVSPDLMISLRKILLESKPKTKFRLRSSTNAEDLIEFNGAGLYDSVGVRREDSNSEIEKKILKVYSSVWNDAAFFEREYFKMDHANIAMGILIHESFKNESANGVILYNIQAKEFLLSSQIGENKVIKDSPNLISETIKIDKATCSLNDLLFESSISPIFFHVKTNEQILFEICKSAKILSEVYVVQYENQKNLTLDIEFKILQESGMNKLYFKQIRPMK